MAIVGPLGDFSRTVFGGDKPQYLETTDPEARPEDRWVPAGLRVNDGSVEAIGTSLLTTYSMAFELISLVLLVAILGALAIARTGRKKE